MISTAPPMLKSCCSSTAAPPPAPYLLSAAASCQTSTTSVPAVVSIAKPHKHLETFCHPCISCLHQNASRYDEVFPSPYVVPLHATASPKSLVSEQPACPRPPLAVVRPACANSVTSDTAILIRLIKHKAIARARSLPVQRANQWRPQGN